MMFASVSWGAGCRRVSPGLRTCWTWKSIACVKLRAADAWDVPLSIAACNSFSKKRTSLGLP